MKNSSSLEVIKGWETPHIQLERARALDKEGLVQLMDAKYLSSTANQSATDLITSLPLDRYTVIWACILSAAMARSELTSREWPVISPVLMLFCQQCDGPAARLAGQEVSDLANKLVRFAIDSGEQEIQRSAVTGLSALLGRYLDSANHNTLTTVSVALLHLCISCDQIDTAYTFVTRHAPTAINLQLFKVTYLDNLLWHYYAGLVHTHKHDLANGMESFERVINAPSEALSAVQLDALKHLLVISLLGNGRWSGVPKSSSLLLRAANSSAFEPYNKLAKLYASDGVNLDQLHAYCTECEEIFRKDKLLGLTHMALDAWTQHRVQALDKTHTVASFQTISRSLGLTDELAPDRWSTLLRSIPDPSVVTDADNQIHLKLNSSDAASRMSLPDMMAQMRTLKDATKALIESEASLSGRRLDLAAPDKKSDPKDERGLQRKVKLMQAEERKGHGREKRGYSRALGTYDDNY